MAAQQPTGADKGVASAEVVAVGAGATAVDATAFANLAAITQLEVKQGNVFWEAVTGGCAANTYIVRTRVSKEEEEQGKKKQPLFILEEKSKCCCRCCCNGSQPFFMKFYNAKIAGEAAAQGCLCCKIPKHDRYAKTSEQAVMTLERPGCFDKLCISGCFVCCACCQSQTYLHAGDVGDDEEVNVGKLEGKNSYSEDGLPSTVFAHSQVPIGGGGCTPTVNMMSRQNGEDTPYGVVEGPMCFGGCMDFCINTDFAISKQPGKAGDIAHITKKARDPGCQGLLIAMCTPIDTYLIDFTDASMTPTNKAQVIAEAIHLDFLFFENEQPVCRWNEQQKQCEILLCLCYCYGCLCPCKIILKGKDQNK